MNGGGQFRIVRNPCEEIGDVKIKDFARFKMQHFFHEHLVFPLDDARSEGSAGDGVVGGNRHFFHPVIGISEVADFAPQFEGSKSRHFPIDFAGGHLHVGDAVEADCPDGIEGQVPPRFFQNDSLHLGQEGLRVGEKAQLHFVREVRRGIGSELVETEKDPVGEAEVFSQGEAILTGECQGEEEEEKVWKEVLHVC